MQARTINQMIKEAQLTGKNVYADRVFPKVGWLLFPVRIVKAKTLNGKIKVQALASGHWFVADNNSTFDAR